MSAIDATLNVVGIDSNALTEGDQPLVEIYLTFGQIINQGPGAPPAVLPLGRIRYLLDKEAAIGAAKKQLEQAEGLPDEQPQADILVANNLSEVEKAAEQMRRAAGQGQ